MQIQLIAYFVFTVSCTEVDLCLQGEHPHRASVMYKFNWSGYDYQPDSMLVLANRVINMWKGSMAVNSLDGKGRYLFNAPVAEDVPEVTQDKNNSIDETLTDNPADSTETGTIDNNPSSEDPLADDSSTGNDDEARTSAESEVYMPVSVFQIPAGDYKFIAFNRNVSELNYSRLDDYYNDPEMSLHGISVSYNILSRENPNLRQLLKDWTDWNPYAGYIQPGSEAIFYDTIAVRKLRSNQQYNITFSPKPLTQHIRVIFDIEKVGAEVPFTIDSVFAEISGVPLSVDLSTGCIDIRKTGKMMYRTDMYTANGKPLLQDTESNNKIKCQKDINVPGIVRSDDNRVLRGPGIMQVYIMASTKDPKRRKKFQGVINLHATLTEADLIHYTPDMQYAVPWGNNKVLYVHLKTPLRIDGKNILENPDDGSGLDVWREVEAGEEIVVDI